MIYFLWTFLLSTEMVICPSFYKTYHRKFLIGNLFSLYALSFFTEMALTPFKVYSIWFFLWALFPYIVGDIHNFFGLTHDKSHITASRASVVCHIFGCLGLGLLNLVFEGYENILFWFSLFYFYNDLAYLFFYDFKIMFVIHHMVAIGCFHLWNVYPSYGRDCLEALLILEKGNLLHAIWDWAKNVGIKPGLGFCKYMTYHYILVRVGYFSWKVYTFIPRLYGDETVHIYHRYIGIGFTFLVYIGSVWWSHKLYLGYQRLVFKTILEKSTIMVEKANQIDQNEKDE